MPETYQFHANARLLALYRTLFRVNRNEDEGMINKRAKEFDFLSALSVLDDTELALFSRQFGLFSGVSEKIIVICRDLRLHRRDAEIMRQNGWRKMREFAGVPEPIFPWTEHP